MNVWIVPPSLVHYQKQPSPIQTELACDSAPSASSLGPAEGTDSESEPSLLPPTTKREEKSVSAEVACSHRLYAVYCWCCQFLYTSMLRLYWLCRFPLPAECSDSRCGGSVRLMKELKDFNVANTVVSSSKSILRVTGVAVHKAKVQSKSKGQ